MRKISIKLISFYRSFISPLFPASCKYYPSCSAYAISAFQTHSFIKALGLSVWRILRCNPWSHGGVDFVPGSNHLSLNPVSQNGQFPQPVEEKL